MSDMQNNNAPEMERKDDQREELALDDARRVKVLSPGMLVFKRFMRNKLAIIGFVILVAMFLFSFVGGVLTPYKQEQVFKHTEAISKRYATAISNTDLRFAVADGFQFGSADQAQMLMNKGSAANGSFTSAGREFAFNKDGEDFYSIYSNTAIATVDALAGNYMFKAAEGSEVELTDEMKEAAKAAIESNSTTFSVGEAQFSLSRDKKTYTIMGMEQVAMATMYGMDAYDQADTRLVAGMDFRYGAQKAMVEGSKTFTVNDVTYTLQANENTYTVMEGETPVAEMSTILVAADSADVFIPVEVKNATREAVLGNRGSFMIGDVEYMIERVNTNYYVNTLKESEVISMYLPPSKDHWLGTDGNGMDMLTRLMYGGRISLMVGFVVIFIEMIIGVIMGGISGFFGGWVDTLIMRFVDLFNCIPYYPMVMIIGSIMDKSKVGSYERIFILMGVLGVLGWTGVARVVRGQILTLREQDFMVATEATGISKGRRIFKHLVPNVMPLLIVQATMGLGGVIISEATLSFLGLGVKYPLASWGAIINAANDAHVMTNYWWAWIPSGFLIVITVLGFNFVGDGLRDAFDPKMKR